MQNTNALDMEKMDEHSLHRFRVKIRDMARNRDLSTHEIIEFFSYVAPGKFLKPEDKVLEVGCGNGYILQGLSAKYGVMPYAIDIADFIKTLQRKDFAEEYIFVPGKINLELGDATVLPWNNNTFDFAYSFMTMIYVIDKLRAIREIHRVIKPGAKAIINTDLDRTWQSIKPNLNIIIEEYPNDCQIEFVAHDRHHAYVDNAGIIITKKSEEALRFPELKSWKYRENAMPFVETDYSR